MARLSTLAGRALGDRRFAGIISAIVGSNLVTSALGMVFWMLATRGLVPEEIGVLGAATAAMSLFGTLGAMGLGPLLIAELPGLREDGRHELFALCVLVAFGVGAVSAGVFAAVAAPLHPTWAPLGPPDAAWWWFVLGSGLTATGLVLDQAMLVVGNPQLQVVRNLIASAWKVAVLAVAVPLAALDLDLALLAWSTGMFVATAMAIVAARRRMPSRVGGLRRHGREVWRTYLGRALEHSGVNYAISLSPMLMPPLMAVLVPPFENGIFTTVRLATLFAFLLPYAVSVSVFARASGNEDVDGAYLRRVLWLSLGLSTLTVVAMVALAHPILLLFGREYADAGVDYLRLMVLAGPLLVFKDNFIARRRIERRVRSLLPFVAISAVLEVGLTIAGALMFGLMGGLAGWLLALLLQAIWCAPRLITDPAPRRAPNTAAADEG
ncbi:MAG: lipopolysaccharide biosynthesis protein [Mobilicoccus sp.]|nr:lipopolysaccharide biosynthesis protein [Mobilicoccus sp.]